MATQEEKKKKLERDHLNRFLELIPERVTTVCERERPDFLVHLNDGRSIAIEHALGVSRHQKAADKSGSALARETEKELEARGLTALITFGVNVNLAQMKPADRKRLAKRLGEWAEHLSEQPSGIPSDGKRFPHELRPLRNICIFQNPEAAVANSAGGMGRGANSVGQVIEKHGGKTDRYRENTNPSELWMLIVSGAGGQGSVDHGELETSRFYPCGFDQIFFLDLFYPGADLKRGLLLRLLLEHEAEAT